MAMLSGVGLPGGGEGKLFTGTWQQNYSFLLKCFTQARVGEGGAVVSGLVTLLLDLRLLVVIASHCLCFQENIMNLSF